MRTLYLSYYKVSQKIDGQIRLLEKDCTVARGKRGLRYLIRQLDKFCETVQERYDGQTSEEQPLIAVARIRPLLPQPDGTFQADMGSCIDQRYIRLPAFADRSVPGRQAMPDDGYRERPLKEGL